MHLFWTSIWKSPCPQIILPHPLPAMSITYPITLLISLSSGGSGGSCPWSLFPICSGVWTESETQGFWSCVRLPYPRSQPDGRRTSGHPTPQVSTPGHQLVCWVPVLHPFSPGSWKVHPVNLKNSCGPHRASRPIGSRAGEIARKRMVLMQVPMPCCLPSHHSKNALGPDQCGVPGLSYLSASLP